MRTNRLKNTMCYLCGPMDRVDDGGVGWRRYITPILKDVGIGVLDPSDKPTPFALEDVAPQVTEPPLETPPSSQDGNTPPPVTPDPVVIHDRPASTHIDCVAMTIETFEAFNRAGIGLDAMAVSRIYNTHFIALSRRGLVR